MKEVAAKQVQVTPSLIVLGQGLSVLEALDVDEVDLELQIYIRGPDLELPRDAALI